MKRLIFNSLLLFIIINSNNLVYGNECKNIDSKITNNEEISNEEKLYINNTIQDFNKNNLNTDSFCLLNIVGKMLYRGLYLPADEDKAGQIFYYLSDNNYPDSQFNLALLLSKKTDNNPYDLIYFLIGLHEKYAADKKYSYLSTKSKALLENYVENLSILSDSCKGYQGGNNICSQYLSVEEIKEIKNKTSLAMIHANRKIYNKAKTINIESKKQADTIFTILSIGALAYSLSAPSYSSPGTSYIPLDPCGGFLPECGFTWRAINLPQIQ